MNTLTVECKNCIRFQLEMAMDDLFVDSQDKTLSFWERRKKKQHARLIRQVLRNPKKLEELEEFVQKKATSYHLEKGMVGEFGDGSIIAWLQDGGLEQILEFLKGLFEIISIFFLLQFILLSIVLGI